MGNAMTPRYFLLVLILLMLPIDPYGAKAQLLFAGGEDVDFICNLGGTCWIATNPSTFRPAWARQAYGAGADTHDPPINRFATPVFQANSQFWIHAQYCNANGACTLNYTDTNAQLLRIFDTAGNPAIVVLGTGVAGQLSIASRTAAGAFTTLTTCSSAFGASLTQLDLFVNYANSGEVTLYNNSVGVCDYTGNVTNGDGATTLNKVEFAGANGAWAGAWSEVIVAKTDTRAMARFTVNTLANGNANGFSGANICSSIWNSISFNDANYGYSGANNILQECTINNSLPPGQYNVLALVMSARALVGATGPQHFSFLTRVGGVDHASAAFAPTTTFSNVQNYIQTVNPATSEAWAVTDFQATGFNIGEETMP
jgi:hypothetical protein